MTKQTTDLSARVIGDSLYLPTEPDPIPLRDIDTILITDASQKKTPGWAVFLAVILFPIGLLFLLAKDDVPMTQITIVRRGLPPSVNWSRGPVAMIYAAWYPIIDAQQHAKAAAMWAAPTPIQRVS